MVDSGPPIEPPATEAQQLTEAEVEQRLAYIDGVNGSAGHRLDDPYLRDLLRKSITGEITSEQYREFGLEHLRTGRALGEPDCA